MKSPTELAATLARQWQNPALREQRWLDPQAWPLQLSIGRPTPRELVEQTAAVREHVARWRAVPVGEIDWQPVSYRGAAEAVELPLHWRIRSAREWADAADDADLHREFHQLDALISRVDHRFHRLLLRQRRLWRDRDMDEVIRAARLALELAPGMAAGQPLRCLSLAGIDSKFFERHRPLIEALLDLRFDGQVSEQGLEAFLDAADEGEHWLLVAPLTPGLLPFAQLRLRASDLRHGALPAARILLVENERCLHRLPELPDTIAVLGAGLDLGWLDAEWLRTRQLGYWGDLDTWGLLMLGRARRLQPHVHALMMDADTFQRHAASMAVVEPQHAADAPPAGLQPDEAALFTRLLSMQRGRIEQEFLPVSEVHAALRAWQSMPSGPWDRKP
jgi:hypothetical protein